MIARLGFLLLIGILGAGACLCSNKEIVRSVSPDGKRVVVVTQRDCGATTACALHVFVVGAQARARGDGDVVLGSGGLDPWPGAIRWSSNEEAVIPVPAGMTVFKKAAVAGGVRLKLEEM